MKSNFFLLPLFALGVVGLSLPVTPEADVEVPDGTHDAASKITAADAWSSVNLNHLDPASGLGATDDASTDEVGVILATSLSTDSTSEESVFELGGLLKRNVNSVRRTINLTLKKAVHGIVGSFTWIIELSINPDEDKSWLGPHRLGARAQFDPLDSTPGTAASTFSARQISHTARQWMTVWRLPLEYSSSFGKLLPTINWQETFSSFAGVWGAEIDGIESVRLSWSQNGQEMYIDPALYEVTISE